MGKKLTKIGKSAKGSIIHIVIDKNNRALCEKKQVGLVVDPALTAEDVTCKRCMATSVYKGLLAGIKISKEIAKEQAANKADKEEADKEKAAKEEADRAKAEAIEESKRCFYGKELRDGSFKLIHRATGKVFFSNIEEEVAPKALEHLNEIEARWMSKHDKIPKEYIPKCREAVALAYKEVDTPLPKAFEDIDEKPRGRIIKRRDDKGKDKKRKILRKTKTKSNAQKLLELVIEKMHGGISLKDLMQNVSEEFELSQKKGSGKTKKTIRRLRKKDITMTIETRPNKDDDIYTIEPV